VGVEEVSVAVMEAVVVGDAVGLQAELQMLPPSRWWLCSPSDLPEPVGGLSFYPHGDESELALILAETIVESCGFNPLLYARRMAERADTLNPVRNYDPGVVEVIEAVRRGRSWLHAARMVNYGAGNSSGNAAVRAAPIVLFYGSERLVEAMAEAQALVTHANPAALEAARVYALALYYTLKGVEPRRLPLLLAEKTGSRQLALRLKLAASLLDAPSPSDVAGRVGNSVHAFDTIASAVYAYARAEGDPLQALLNAVSLGGNTGAIAAAALALAAAHGGTVEKATRTLPATVEDVEYARKLGLKLAEAKTSCRGM
jgi:poly(ADP-ribose) glycohydrolase ARH3